MGVKLTHLEILKGELKVKTGPRIRPEEYILSVLSPEERLQAAFKIARQAFKSTTFTVKDIEKAVEKIRKRSFQDAQS